MARINGVTLFTASKSSRILSALARPHTLNKFLERIFSKISEFFGIMIYMYWFDNQKHKLPHFHARYQGAEAVFSLEGNCIEGRLGNRASKLIQEWAQENSQELEEAWQMAIHGKEVPWITPLK